MYYTPFSHTNNKQKTRCFYFCVWSFTDYVTIVLKAPQTKKIQVCKQFNEMQNSRKRKCQEHKEEQGANKLARPREPKFDSAKPHEPDDFCLCFTIPMITDCFQDRAFEALRVPRNERTQATVQKYLKEYWAFRRKLINPKITRSLDQGMFSSMPAFMKNVVMSPMRTQRTNPGEMNMWKLTEVAEEFCRVMTYRLYLISEVQTLLLCLRSRKGLGLKHPFIYNDLRFLICSFLVPIKA